MFSGMAVSSCKAALLLSSSSISILFLLFDEFGRGYTVSCLLLYQHTTMMTMIMTITAATTDMAMMRMLLWLAYSSEV